MKVIIIFAIFFVASGSGGPVSVKYPESTLEVKGPIEDLIKNFVNRVIQSIVAGLPCIGIPPLDPLEIELLELNIDETLLKLGGNLTNIQVEGLGNLTVPNVKLVPGANSTYSVDIEFTLPQLQISGKYDIDGLAVVIFPIFGNGNFKIIVGSAGVAAGFTIRLPLIGPISVDNFKVEIEVGELSVNFEGILGGGDFGDTINEIISSVGLRIFNLIKDTLNRIISSCLGRVISDAVDGLTLKDIIDLIIGGGTIPLNPCHSNRIINDKLLLK